MIGLCARARKLAPGANLACDSVRAGKAHTVCLAADASANTRKKVTNCCTYYGVHLTELEASCSELGHIIGKRGNVSCVAIEDENFAKAILTSITR